MTVFLNILIGVLIFGYAGYAFWKSIQTKKTGKCGSCELQKHCSSRSCDK
ncbi:MAG: FeoB-associated Cys-rich membrane protein [Bacillus sp. (in: firmicutes)]